MDKKQNWIKKYIIIILGIFKNKQEAVRTGCCIVDNNTVCSPGSYRSSYRGWSQSTETKPIPGSYKGSNSNLPFKGGVQLFWRIPRMFREENVAHEGYNHAGAKHLPRVMRYKWVSKTGLWCCHFVPRVADLVTEGVHGAAGTLPSTVSTFILSTGLFWVF